MIKNITQIQTELNDLRNQIRRKIIKALSKSPDYHLDLDEDMILNPTYVYYSDGDGNPYEGRVKAVGYEFDQLVIWTDNFDFPTEICEKEFSFTLRSHEWLIGILENICDVLTIDINKL